MNNILWLELVIGIIVSFSLLGIFIWALRQGQFDDQKKMMDGMFFDSEDDLNAAIAQERKAKELKEKKAQKNEQKKGEA